MVFQSEAELDELNGGHLVLDCPIDKKGALLPIKDFAIVLSIDCKPDSVPGEEHFSNPPARAMHRGWNLSAVKTVLIMFISALLFITFLLRMPLSQTLEIGADEGFELAKATLLLHGHKLYGEVWNDQPPLHTWLITHVLEAGGGVEGARLVSVGFAALLITLLFIISQKLWRRTLAQDGSNSEKCGLICGVASALILITSPGFLELSCSCMLEVPALSLAVAGVVAVFLGRAGKWKIREIAAGVFFGLGCEMKLIALVLMPVAVLLLIICGRKEEESMFDVKKTGGASKYPRMSSKCAQTSSPGKRSSLVSRLRSSSPSDTAQRFDGKGLLVFSLSFLIVFVGVDFIIDGGAFLLHFHQSWISHFATAKSYEYGSADEHPYQWSVLLKNWDATILAVMSVAVALKYGPRRLLLLVPGVWLVWTLIVFSVHRPWWPYYYVHNAVPIALCSGMGIAYLLKDLSWKKDKILVIVCSLFLVAASGWMVARVYLEVRDIQKLPKISSTLAIAEIERYKSYARMLYADEPIFSFHTDIPMPAELAVVPLKRLWSGDMTNVRIAQEMERAKPQLMLLLNDNRERPFSELLMREYQLVYEDKDRRLFARRDIARLARF